VTTYTITVPKIAKYMNANDRPNRWDRARAIALWREAGRIAAVTASSRMALPLHPVRIIATVHISDKRRREVSNYFPTFKAIVDGFVSAGILADDSDAHVIGPDPRRGYDKVPRIVFELTEVA